MITQSNLNVSIPAEGFVASLELFRVGQRDPALNSVLTYIDAHGFDRFDGERGGGAVRF